MDGEYLKGMLDDLIEMTEDNFQDCVEYVKNAGFSENVRNALENLIQSAREYRNKETELSVTA